MEKIHHACMVHAESALQAKEAGDVETYDRACELLNQCATVGRRKMKAGVINVQERLGKLMEKYAD